MPSQPNKLIRVVHYDPNWPMMFHEAASEVRPIMGSNLVAIHHIGSTSIPGIHAKPVIDILAEVNDVSIVDQISSQMEKIGYEVMGEFGIQGRRYFRRDNPLGVRTHQIHTFQTGSIDVKRHLAFRDYLRAHPLHTIAYSSLKEKLAHDHPYDMNAYMDGKDGFIKDIQSKAMKWAGYDPK